MEEYKRHARKPALGDYANVLSMYKPGSTISKRHESDYYLFDPETGTHYLIELKIGGDLGNKKARSEKEALLEQYCILINSLGTQENVEFKLEEWVDDFIRVLKPTGNLFIFTSYNQLGRWYDCLDARFSATQFMVWHKTNPAPKIFKAGFLNSCEMIFCCWNKRHTWNFISQQEVHNFIESPICARPERLASPKHPAQKPTSILKKMITIASNEGDVVFAPFMGVGSVGVAAQALGRRFIGFELDAEYFRAAKDRMETRGY